MTNYKLILNKEDFINNNISEEKQEKYNLLSRDIISKSMNNKIRTITKSGFRYMKCNDIANQQKELFENINEKIMFYINTVFYDNEDFVRLTKATGLTNYDIERLMMELMMHKKYPQNFKNLKSKFEGNINKLMMYLGINNRELVLNKLQQLYYCHNELFIEKQKQV